MLLLLQILPKTKLGHIKKIIARSIHVKTSDFSLQTMAGEQLSYLDVAFETYKVLAGDERTWRSTIDVRV